MSTEIDLDYRPETYFQPKKLERHLLSKVKGTVLRRELQALVDAGRDAAVRALLTPNGVPPVIRKAYESIHPMYMGGNYLPDPEDGEVEIARITLKSVTYDVACVYARPDGGAIHYRVVDEYGGETLQGTTEARTERPMTLGELTDFFLAAYSLLEVLERNFPDDLDARLDFFIAESEFYPDFDRLCRQRVIESFSGAGRAER